MAVTIPIISEFNGKGIEKAIKQFQQLETTGEKAQFALKKAALPAAAAFGAVTAGLTLATKAAIEDEQAQTQLANTLKNTVKATDQQIKATENSISKMSRQSGIADDKLRPAFAALTLGTKDLAQNPRSDARRPDTRTPPKMCRTPQTASRPSQWCAPLGRQIRACAARSWRGR